MEVNLKFDWTDSGGAAASKDLEAASLAIRKLLDGKEPFTGRPLLLPSSINNGNDVNSMLATFEPGATTAIGVLLIGRDENKCHVVVPSKTRGGPLFSRAHCILMFFVENSSVQMMAMDLGSLNGSFTERDGKLGKDVPSSKAQQMINVHFGAGAKISVGEALKTPYVSITVSAKLAEAAVLAARSASTNPTQDAEKVVEMSKPADITSVTTKQTTNVVEVVKPTTIEVVKPILKKPLPPPPAPQHDSIDNILSEHITTYKSFSSGSHLNLKSSTNQLPLSSPPPKPSVVTFKPLTPEPQEPEVPKQHLDVVQHNEQKTIDPPPLPSSAVVAADLEGPELAEGPVVPVTPQSSKAVNAPEQPNPEAQLVPNSPNVDEQPVAKLHEEQKQDTPAPHVEANLSAAADVPARGASVMSLFSQDSGPVFLRRTKTGPALASSSAKLDKNPTVYSFGDLEAPPEEPTEHNAQPCDEPELPVEEEQVQLKANTPVAKKSTEPSGQDKKKKPKKKGNTNANVTVSEFLAQLQEPVVTMSEGAVKAAQQVRAQMRFLTTKKTQEEDELIVPASIEDDQPALSDNVSEQFIVDNGPPPVVQPPQAQVTVDVQNDDSQPLVIGSIKHMTMDSLTMGYSQGAEMLEMSECIVTTTAQKNTQQSPLGARMSLQNTLFPPSFHGNQQFDTAKSTADGRDGDTIEEGIVVNNQVIVAKKVRDSPAEQTWIPSAQSSTALGGFQSQMWITAQNALHVPHHRVTEPEPEPEEEPASSPPPAKETKKKTKKTTAALKRERLNAAISLIPDLGSGRKPNTTKVVGNVTERIEETGAKLRLVNPGHLHAFFAPPMLHQLLMPHQWEAVRFAWNLWFGGGSKEKSKEFLLAGCVLPAKKKRVHLNANPSQEQYEFEDAEDEPVEDASRGCVVAHGMGLGKTFTTISLILLLWRYESERQLQYPSMPKRKVLLVAPKSVIFHWMREFEKWTTHSGEEAVHLCYLSGEKKNFRELIDFWKNKDRAVLLISTSLLGSIMGDRKPRRGAKASAAAGGIWDDPDEADVDDGQPELVESAAKELREALLTLTRVIVLDEAHKVGSTTSKIGSALSKFSKVLKLALTGTPVSKGRSEQLDALLQFVDPSIWGKRDFSEEKLGEYVQNVMHSRSISVIRDVLPTVSDISVKVQLSPLQWKLFCGAMTALTDKASVPKRNYLEAVRVSNMISNHVFLAAQWYAKSLEKDANAAKKPRVLWASMALEAASPFVDASASAETSWKAMFVMLLLQEALERNEKVVLFSNSKQTLHILGYMLHDAGLTDVEDFAILDGSLAAAARDELMQRFNDPEDTLSVALLSQQSCAVGMSFTGANRVILYDCGWNAADDEQAIFRVFRYGQTKHVSIVRLFSDNGVEDSLRARRSDSLRPPTSVLPKSELLRDRRAHRAAPINIGGIDPALQYAIDSSPEVVSEVLVHETFDE